MIAVLHMGATRWRKLTHTSLELLQGNEYSFHTAFLMFQIFHCVIPNEKFCTAALLPTSIITHIISITSACCRTSPHWQTSYRHLTRVIRSSGVVLSPACKFMKLWGATFWPCPFCKWDWNAPFSSWEPPCPSLIVLGKKKKKKD